MYTETQLSKLIEDVEKEFTAHLAKAEEGFKVSLAKSEEANANSEPLAKAEEGEKKPPTEKKPEAKEGKEEGKEAPSHDGKEAAPAPAEGEKPAEGAPAPEAKEGAPAPAEGAPAPAQGGDQCDYDAEDLEHMSKMYMSMSKGELLAHHDAVRKALDTKGMGEPMMKSELNAHPDNAPKPKDNGKSLDSDPANGGIVEQAPDNTPGAKSEASGPAGKKPKKAPDSKRNGGEEEGQEPHGSPGAKSEASKAEGNQMEKSEVELVKAELDAEKAKNVSLQKNFDAVQVFLTKLVEKKVAPAGKAITSLDAITKSEGIEEKTLTKSEIDQILFKKSSDPLLKSEDRQAINAYYLNGAGINSISHLLK